MSSLDFLRLYTAPRGVLVGVLFVLAVVCRVPAAVLAIVVHVLDRAAERVLAWADQVPPAPATVVRRSRRW